MAGGLLVVMAAAWLHKTVRCMHLLTPLAEVKPARHRVIGNAIGAEDIVATRAGYLIVSSDSRSNAPGPTPGGCLLGCHAAAPGTWTTLWGGAEADFHPHGIAYFEDGDGKQYLYVINHAWRHDQVDIFLILPAPETVRLEHVRSVPFPGIRCLNDLVVLAPDRFYVTVDHGSSHPLLNHIADYLRLPTGSVLYHDGERITRAASGIVFANGIAAHGDQVYVASTLLCCIFVYQRDDVSGRLFRRFSFDLGGSPDNITVTDNGDLLVAVHPRILALARQRRDRGFRAPSLVRQVRIGQRGQIRLRTLYGDDGQQLACASVAVQQGSSMWIGSVYDDRVVVCDNLDFAGPL